MIHRYAIDELQGSGANALLLVSLVAMLRRLKPTEKAPPTLQSLIGELDQAARAKKKDASFAKYFNAPRLHQFRNSTVAANLLADYISKELRRDLYKNFVQPGNVTPELVETCLSMPAEEILSSIMSNAGLTAPHPKFYWSQGERHFVRANSSTSLKLNLLGYSKKYISQNPEIGVFYIIREARGVFQRKVTDEDDRTVMLVKDILWLRQTSDELLDEDRMWMGCFFSSYDRGVYLIHNVKIISNGQIQLFGQKMLAEDHDDDSHFYVTMPCLDRANQSTPHRLGLLCGSTSNLKRSSAWKIAVLQPPNHAELALALETIVQQPVYMTDGGKVHATLSTRYDRLRGGLSYLQGNRHMGVIAAHAWAEKNPAEKEALSALRLAFKRLVATEMPPLVDNTTRMLFEDLLNKPAKKALAELRAGRFSTEAVNNLLDNILRSWATLEPLHLFAPYPSVLGTKDASSKAGSINELLRAEPKAPDGDAVKGFRPK